MYYKRKLHNFIYFLSIAIIGILFSCKTIKPIAKEYPPLRAAKLYDNVIENQPQYTSLSIRFSAAVEIDSKSYSFSGTLRIKRDSLIWVTLSPALGIEAARVLITPDSVCFVNRINKTFYAGDYSQLNDIFDMEFDFNSIEAILSHSLFSYPPHKNEDRSFKRYKTTFENSNYILQSLKEKKINKKLKKQSRRNNPRKELVAQNINIDSESFKIIKVLIIDFTNNRTLNIDYKDELQFENQSIAKEIFINFTQIEKAGKIEIKYAKVPAEDELSFPYSVPENYTEIR